MSLTTRNLSHQERGGSFQEAYEGLKRRIEGRGLADGEVRKQLGLLEGLGQFELGRFLIEKGGLNGFWTNYIVTYRKGESLHELESYLLDRAPTILATQERFGIFKREIQKRLREGGTYASILVD
jgi:hypothetical protein